MTDGIVDSFPSRTSAEAFSVAVGEAGPDRGADCLSGSSALGWGGLPLS